MEVIRRLFSALFSDFHWKLLSLVVAGAIWFVGMNMNNPFLNQTVSPRLQLDSIGIMAREGIIVLNEEALRDINVPVLMRALRSDMNKLTAAMADADLLADFITVGVDFRAIDSEAVAAADGVSSQYLRIAANMQSGFEQISITPAYVEVLLDIAVRDVFSVDIIRHGDVPPGFELQDIRLSNSHVTIRGPRSEIARIDQVQAHVDITGVFDDAEFFNVPFRVMDSYGHEMTDYVTLNVSETTAFMRVWQIRTVPIVTVGVGSAATGFAAAGISSGLSSLDVVGTDEALAQLQNIRVEIDLSGASANIAQTVDINDWLPEGVYLRYGEPYNMGVVARIEPIQERTLTIPHENLRSRGIAVLYQLVYENEVIRITASGPLSLITQLDANEIEPEFDLRRLPIGVHTVPLAVDLPTGITLVGSPPTLTVQIHEPAIVGVEEEEEEEDDYYVPNYITYVSPYDDPYDNPYEPPQGADDDEYEAPPETEDEE
ncbi:MAG: CdaR family protein [Defluviitaleaceae bacterium]|nr:CdaR family protein [Defluviitaleaceae bacterium]